MRRWMLAGSLALACGEATLIAEAEVADVCGQPGPAQILALEREEVVNEGWPTVRHGDRYLYGIRTFDHPISNVEVTRGPAALRRYAELGARLESMDRCGDDRRVIAEGVDTVIAPRSDAEPWLAMRSETRTLFWIDPEARWAPREIFEIDVLGAQVVTDNVVHAFREEEQAIFRATLVGDAPIIETLLDNVVDAQLSAFRTSDTPPSVYALRTDGELLLVQLRSGRMESVAKGVGGFLTDVDPRFVVWWPGDVGATFPAPITEATAVDRARAVTHSLALGDGATLSFAIWGPVLATWFTGEDPNRPGHDDILQTRLTFLPDMRSILVDGEWDPHGSSDGQFFTARSPLVFDGDHAVGGSWHLFESRADGIQLVADRLGDAGHDGAIWSGTCDEASGYVRACELTRAPFTTLVPEVVEPRMFSRIALPDDRWLVFAPKPYAPDAWRPDPRGTLWIVDGATSHQARLDHEVSTGFPLLEPHELSSELWHTDEVVYQVRSLDTDRTGLWRARFE